MITSVDVQGDLVEPFKKEHDMKLATLSLPENLTGWKHLRID